jgi:hypothetical protein
MPRAPVLVEYEIFVDLPMRKACGTAKIPVNAAHLGIRGRRPGDF